MFADGDRASVVAPVRIERLQREDLHSHEIVVPAGVRVVREYQGEVRDGVREDLQRVVRIDRPVESFPAAPADARSGLRLNLRFKQRRFVHYALTGGDLLEMLVRV